MKNSTFLAVIEMIVGAVIAGVGAVATPMLFFGSWIGFAGPFAIYGGYQLAKHGEKSFKQLREQSKQTRK